MMMNDSGEISNLLDQLQESTGLSLCLDPQVPADPQVTAGKLRDLLRLTKSSRDKHYFLRRYLTGQLDEDEIRSGFARHHMQASARRALLLVTFPEDLHEETRSILSSIFPRSQVSPLSMGRDRMLLIVKGKPSSLSPMVSALLDTMASEAMIPVKVVYDNQTVTLADLPAAYQDLVTSLAIGKTFYPAEQVYESASLGLARLIFRLPEDVCQRYLQEHFLDYDFGRMDADTLRAIHTLFHNNLSLSETARQLFIHRNTLAYRLDKFQKASGLDVRNFDEAITCRIGMMIWQKLHQKSR